MVGVDVPWHPRTLQLTGYTYPGELHQTGMEVYVKHYYHNPKVPYTVKENCKRPKFKTLQTLPASCTNITNHPVKNVRSHWVNVYKVNLTSEDV